MCNDVAPQRGFNFNTKSLILQTLGFSEAPKGRKICSISSPFQHKPRRGATDSKVALHKNCQRTTFNNVITPIATILAFIIYYATLIEIKNSNNKNIGFQKVILIKNKIENLRTKLENNKINVPIHFQENFKLSGNYTHINFFYLFQSIHQGMREIIVNGENDISDYSGFLFGICFEFKFNFHQIDFIIDQIEESRFDILERNTLNELLIEILNDYLMLHKVGEMMPLNFNYPSSSNSLLIVKGYDVPIYLHDSNQPTTVFDCLDFNRLYLRIKNAKMIQ